MSTDIHCPICSSKIDIPNECKKYNDHTLLIYSSGYTIFLYAQTFYVMAYSNEIPKTDFILKEKNIYSHSEFIPLNEIKKYIDKISNIRAFL